MRKERLENSIPEKAAAAISAAHLLHPAKHFGHPREVLAAVEIGKDEKRALLASWASDMFAIISSSRKRYGSTIVSKSGEPVEQGTLL